MISPESFRPIGKWVLVEADPRVKKTPGGIHLPEQLVGVERVMEGTGRILRTGNEVPEEDVKEGDRICFRGFLKDVTIGLFENRDVFVVHLDDVLASIGEEVTMGAFSG